MTAKKIFDRLIERYIFPKFHNTLTKTVVIGGLSLLGKSLLVWFIELFVQIRFDTNISNNDSLYGIGLVVLGLTFHLMSEHRIARYGSESISIEPESDKKSFEHDQSVFNKINSLIDEDFIVRFVSELSASAIYKFEDDDRIAIFLGEIVKTKYQYLSSDIDESKVLFVDSIKKLKHFLTYNFDAISGSSYDYSKLCRPESNPYADREEYSHLDYDELFKLLGELLWEMKRVYDSYRMKVKEILYV